MSPPSNKPRWLKGNLITLGIMVVLAVGFVWWMTRGWMDQLADALADAFGDQMAEISVMLTLELMPEGSKLPATEMEEVSQQARRLGQLAKQDRISDERMAIILEEFAKSAFSSSFALSASELEFLNHSGLSDEEKESGGVTLARVISGIATGKMNPDELEQLSNEFTVAKGNRQELKPDLTDEELRSLLTRMDAAADKAGVRKRTEEIDLSDELRRMIDAAVGEPKSNRDAP